jgi:hypothetical protein
MRQSADVHAERDTERVQPEAGQQDDDVAPAGARAAPGAAEGPAAVERVAVDGARAERDDRRGDRRHAGADEQRVGRERDRRVRGAHEQVAEELAAHLSSRSK